MEGCTLSALTVSGYTLQVITGYLLAGSAIGPGGFSFVSELVQVNAEALKLQG